jgi:hypothetical protein
MITRPTFEVLKSLTKVQMETVAFVLRLPQDKGQQYTPSDILAHLTIQRGRYQPGTACVKLIVCMHGRTSTNSYRYIAFPDSVTQKRHHLLRRSLICAPNPSKMPTRISCNNWPADWPHKTYRVVSTTVQWCSVHVCVCVCVCVSVYERVCVCV